MSISSTSIAATTSAKRRANSRSAAEPIAAPVKTLRKRATPLLGTVVEIAVDTNDEAEFVDATDAAFTRIAEVHRAMSFHESSSDLAAIAHAEVGARLRIFSDTWKTLSLAIEMERRSNGLFNPTVAPTLVQRGVLPQPAAVHARQARKTPALQSSLAESISLEADNHIRVRKRVWIDLGGIAKGYAVDAAVITLQAHGIQAGVVNAGGDLRVFGNFEHTIAVRMPSQPNQVFPLAVLKNLSCATTAMYFTTADTIVNPHPDGRSIRPQKYESISVVAPSCAVADALTKIMWLQDLDSAACRATLDHFNAYAALLDSAGNIKRL